MTLFTSLYTGVNGMNAQSQATASISTNIANLTTVGYKKTETTFRDLVVNNTRPSRFANGGVMTTQINRISNQGALQQAQSSTELGINGEGFFIVKTSDDDNLPYLYTRNGSFTPDVNGVLRNAAGFILYGWPVDENGNLTSGATLTSVQPVDINQLDDESRPTTTAQLGINLDASDSSVNPQFLSAPLTGTLPVSEQSTWDTVLKTTIDNSSAANFSRGMTVYDDMGNARELVFEFRHITGPMAQATSNANGMSYDTKLNDPTFFGGIVNGDTFTISTGAATQTFTVGTGAGEVETVGELLNGINTQLGGGTAVDAMLDANGRIVLKATDPTATLTIGGTVATGANSLEFPGTVFAPLLANINSNASYPDQQDFPPFGDLTAPNTNGWWEVRVLQEPDPSLTDLDAMYGQSVEISKGLINFDSRGQMNVQRDADGNVADGTLTINPQVFDASTGADLGDIQIDMSKFRQYAGGYNVLINNQNGAEAGSIAGVIIGTDGMVTARFTNNDEIPIFQIPLARFVNPDGLNPLTGTVFQQTADAGELTVLAANEDGMGLIQASTLEQSNVDLADEFAKMIVSQRAFQANSRVVSTVDEMTQQLRQLKS